MKTVHIARKYVSIEGGAKHFYEEAIFSSYKSAYSFIQRISEEDDDIFLSEIISYPLDDSSPCEKQRIYTFDRKGSLINEYNAIDRYNNCHVVEKDGYKTVYKNPDPDSFSGKFKVGDFVFIQAFPWNKLSPSHVDKIGVIASTPIFFKEWVADGNDKYEWDNAYVVNTIRDGYIDHLHVEESSMTCLGKELPNNLLFLKILSDHLLSRKSIPPEVMEEIYRGDIFVENVKHFCFD